VAQEGLFSFTVFRLVLQERDCLSCWGQAQQVFLAVIDGAIRRSRRSRKPGLALKTPAVRANEPSIFNRPY
jgi:hypothetical protein